MGYMTVFTVLNDGMHKVRNDPEVGRTLSDMANAWQSREYINGVYSDNVYVSDGYVSGGSGNFVNCLAVGGVAHADVPQVIVAKWNSLYNANNEKDWKSIEGDLIYLLESHGFKVTKKKSKE